jgi:ribonuclease G
MRKNIDTIHEIKVIVNPDLLERLRTEDEELLVDIERRYGGRLSFKPDPTLHREKFVITDANTGEELKA